MEIALIACRVLLAVVFAVAGVAKLADLAGSRRSMIEFGIPEALAGASGILLPVAELVTSVALLPASTAWHGAAAALALLLLFILGISYNLARGRKPDCHCFGQLHSSPAGWKTLTRNLILAAVAALVLWPGPGRPQPGLLSQASALSRGEIALLIGGLGLVLILSLNFWLLVNLLRQNGRLLLRIEAIEEKLGMGQESPAPAGLPVDSPAPDFTLDALDGGSIALRTLWTSGKPALLIFVEPGCRPCDSLLHEVSGWQKNHGDRLTVAVISRGGPEANRHKKAKYNLAVLLLQKEDEAAEAYQCRGRPGAVLIRSDGTIGSHLAEGPEEIKVLFRRATIPPAATMGDKAPQVRLPNLAGRNVDLESFRGRLTIVLFWNPSCGFCREMLEDLKVWERQAHGDGRALLVVSAGTAEDNRAQGFQSPVLLDEGFGAGYAFGAAGTPSAVLVDAEGKIASKVAVGAEEVWRLVRGV